MATFISLANGNRLIFFLFLQHTKIYFLGVIQKKNKISVAE